MGTTGMEKTMGSTTTNGGNMVTGQNMMGGQQTGMMGQSGQTGMTGTQTGMTGTGMQQQGQQPQQLGSYTGGMGAGFPSSTMQELMNWDPFRDMGMMGSLMPFGSNLGMMNQFGMGSGNELSRALSQLQPMKLDIIENPNEYVVRADVPGYTRENVKIEVDDRTNMLHISTQRRDEREDQGERGGYTYHRVERSSGSNYRALRLPDNANASNVNATVVNGVLNVQIPKREGVSATGRRRVNIV